ncbi:MAG: SufE family protein [Opitutales bacterium]|nr:SufE family protein [Opitutales bacterium]
MESTTCIGFDEKRVRLEEDLAALPDAYERFGYLVDLGRTHCGLSAEEQTPERKVEGCVSNVHLLEALEDGRCQFRVEADSAIVKGIAALLCDLYSGEPPECVVAREPDFLEEFGITQHLSPNRRNGLTQVYKRMKAFAVHALAADETARA